MNQPRVATLVKAWTSLECERIRQFTLAATWFKVSVRGNVSVDLPMNQSTFKLLLILLAAGFAVALAAICLPPLIDNPDLIAAITSGFVNPYATGYSLDAITCWFVLAVWVWYEAKEKRIRHGWLALALGVVPGVATGFAVYLLLRLQQESVVNDKTDESERAKA